MSELDDLSDLFFKEATNQCALYAFMIENMPPPRPKTDIEKWWDWQEECRIRLSKKIYDWSGYEDGY